MKNQYTYQKTYSDNFNNNIDYDFNLEQKRQELELKLLSSKLQIQMIERVTELSINILRSIKNITK